MKVSELFPRKYAIGADLQGKPVTLTILRVVLEEMRPNPKAPKEKKGVLYFSEAQKGVVLSRKMADQIVDILNGEDEMNNWPGVRITIYPVPMQVAGQQRIAIRARKPGPTNGHKAPPETMQEEEEERVVDPVTGEVTG